MVKVMGVEQGNIYWKRFEDGLCNNNYQFKVINDEWFKINYPNFKYLLDGQPEEVRLKRNLRVYENKENK